jgi:hypothetical protein
VEFPWILSRFCPGLDEANDSPANYGLRARRDKQDETRSTLAEVYDWFTEGSSTQRFDGCETVDAQTDNNELQSHSCVKGVDRSFPARPAIHASPIASERNWTKGALARKASSTQFMKCGPQTCRSSSGELVAKSLRLMSSISGCFGS